MELHAHATGSAPDVTYYIIFHFYKQYQNGKCPYVCFQLLLTDITFMKNRPIVGSVTLLYNGNL